MAKTTKSNTSTRTRQERPLATWRGAFLLALRENANVSAACRAAEVDRSWTYRCREADPSFAAEWEEALAVAVESLEERAWRRAKFQDIQYKFNPKSGAPLRHPVTGEPYFEYVGSDTMLVTLLKAHKPDKYKERSAVDMNTTLVVEPAYDLSKLSLEEKLTLREIKRKLLTSGEGDAHE